jgi:hypothetical protein
MPVLLGPAICGPLLAERPRRRVVGMGSVEFMIHHVTRYERNRLRIPGLLPSCGTERFAGLALTVMAS